MPVKSNTVDWILILWRKSVKCTVIVFKMHVRLCISSSDKSVKAWLSCVQQKKTIFLRFHDEYIHSDNFDHFNYFYKFKKNINYVTQVPAVILNPSLTTIAQKWAEELALMRDQTLQTHSGEVYHGRRLGENISSSSSTSHAPVLYQGMTSHALA